MVINALALLIFLGSSVVIRPSTMKTMKILTVLTGLCGTQATLSNGLIRFYRGDGDASDATGNGPTLTGEAGYTEVSFPVSGTTRKVFDFITTQNGLAGSVADLPSGSSSRTILGWFKLIGSQLNDGGRSDGDPFGYGTHISNNNYYVDIYKVNGKFRVELDVYSYTEGVNPIMETSETRWYHLVIMYDQGTNKNIVYLDGSFLKDGTPNIVPNTQVNGVNSRLFIGEPAFTNSNLASYRGQVADVAVFNRILTSDEVQQIYSNDRWYTIASGGGDPHFQGFGGNYFTWQGECDVVLITSTHTRKDEIPNFQIQIRTRRVRKWSTIDTIVIKAEDNIAEIESREGKLTLNGSHVPSINTTTMSVGKAVSKKKKLMYKFVFDGDKYLEVTANTRTNMIYIKLSGNYSKNTRGILGSPSKPGFFGRDGTAIEGNVNSFVEHWQASDKDPQLFREPRYPQYPEKCTYNVRNQSTGVRSSRRLKEKSTITTREATAACSIHRSGPLREFCIDDVIRTGDLDIADDEFYG